MVVNSNKNQNASCPYCASKFKGNEDLSKHIDRIHHGLGLLEVTHEGGEPVNTDRAHICAALKTI